MNNKGNKEKSRQAVRQGIKTLREARQKEPYNHKYEAKEK
jgi:hypothetical protein